MRWACFTDRRSFVSATLGCASYLFNSTIAGIEEADAILLIGTNPRKEAAVLNSRIRKRYLKGKVLIGVIGEQADLSYPYTYLGAGPESLEALVSHAPAKAEKPMFIIGQGLLNRKRHAPPCCVAARTP